MTVARAVSAPGPAPARAGGRLRRLGAWLAAHRRGVGYALFSAVVFLIALLYTLPHDLIARRAIEQATARAPIDVVFREVAYAFPNGYRFSGLRLSSREAPELGLELEELSVRAPLATLLTGGRAAAFSGTLFGGQVEGTMAAAGPGATVEMAAEDLDLGQASALYLPAPSRLGGRASFELRLSGDGATTRSAQGEIDLEVRGLRLEKLLVQGITLPDLGFDQVRGTAQLRASRLQIPELTADGPEVDVSLSGDILVREPIEQSVLNLELGLDVPANAPPAVKVATALLPPKPAGQPQKWSLRGTMARPVVK